LLDKKIGAMRFFFARKAGRLPASPQSPAWRIMEQTLAHCVQYSLQNFLYDNATFMAERLYAQEKSDLAKYLLASCYYRAGKFYKVYALLKGSTFERNRYLLAMSAFRMEKYRDAEIALVGDCFTGNEVLENIPNGAAGLFLFGQICRFVLSFVLFIVTMKFTF
jgi:anaphase-promoting complex subunit 3